MKSIIIFAVFVLLFQSIDSYKTFECVQKDEAPSVIPVAFYAYISRTFKALSVYKPFIFDAVETNLGNGYDRRTGIFTAPSSGVFAFSWTIHAAGTHHAGSSGQYGEMGAVLTQNGVAKGSVYADTEKQYDDASATGFVILAASKGDKFQIICPMAGQGAFYSTKINGRTSFSGYRIA
uniref:C1q domain-containing protein n=2 Tax=Magallana gigas TaxID=29159 RepID=A0A8W8JEH0_MAGGI|nr:collagen alpha-1(X) chain-like [Crassostrea gigas]